MCARPPGDTVASAHRGEAFISRRATRWRTADENRRERRSTVTYLVWSSRQAKGDRRRDGDDLTVFGLDQLPSALMHHPMVPATQKDEVVEVGRPALDPAQEMMPIALRGRSL